MAKIGSFEVTPFEHTRVGKNEAAKMQLEKLWEEIDNDPHTYERSSWLAHIWVQTQLDDTGKAVAFLNLREIEQIAESLNSHENWSCVQYSYSPCEASWMVFIHNEPEKPLFRGEAKAQCLKAVAGVGGKQDVFLQHNRNGFSISMVYINSIEGIYKGYMKTKNNQTI